MASSHSLSLRTPPLPFPRRRFSHVSLAGGFPVTLRARAIPEAAELVLRYVAESDGSSLPCVRTFENDAARLVLFGAADFNQALTAAAADGGRAADEHLESGLAAMVVETVFPGSADERGTVSTRLFLPTKKVKEKARKLRTSFDGDAMFDTSFQNILAMTFRQVVIQQLWTFELAMFTPGAERNMEDLDNPREVSTSFTLSCTEDQRVMSALSEAVCASVLQSTERNFLDSYLGDSSSDIFHWFQKPRRIESKDSLVIITKLVEDDVVEHAKSIFSDFNSTKARFKPPRNNLKHGGWSPLTHSRLEKIGGSQFVAWTSVHIPAYKIQINGDRLKDIKLEGWLKCSDKTWEVLLTNSQMGGLAGIIDMYYEDPYTVPNKELSYEVAGNFSNLPTKKRNSFLLKMLSVTVATGIFIVAVSAFGQLRLPRYKAHKYAGEHVSLPASETLDSVCQSLDDDELEKICVSAVKTVKDGLDWSGFIMKDSHMGVWTGKLPEYLKVAEDDSNIEVITDPDIKTSAEDIASYQVVYSLDGKLVGFQPTSRVAVNQWAANPLANELYGGRKLSPGLLEPGLKVSQPREGVIAIELLMSTKPDASFALARPRR